MWVFGYGSLVWRPSIPFEKRTAGRIRGYVRRFYQGSTDHRGVPGKPGRVVTLLPDADGFVTGMAYQVPKADQMRVLARLDHREKGGYVRDNVVVEPLDGSPSFEALVYIATASNPNYLGAAPIDIIAAQVRVAVGPSGPNIEYVVELARALRALGDDDEHVRSIEAALSAL